jgi:transcriptional regulator with XRE-family HTH domain
VTRIDPTVHQRELGERLRKLRSERGMTVEDVAQSLLCSAAKISGLETGLRRQSLRDIRDLCSIYNADDSTSVELMDLARGAREQTWWTQYEDLNLDPYLGQEQEATAITSFTTYYIPALLQTEDYTRVIIGTIAPKMDPGIFEQRVEVRMRRQAILERDIRPRFSVFLDEAVLHRQVGNAALMAAQLAKVLEAAHDGKATIQVIRFDVGIPATVDSNFVLLEFGEDRDISPIVFVEGLTVNQYLEREVDLNRYREAVGYLRDSAISPDASIQYVADKRLRYLSR